MANRAPHAVFKAPDALSFVAAVDADGEPYQSVPVNSF